MEKIIQTNFAEPKDLKRIKNRRLVIHQRSEPSNATHLAIFIHGLGGSRYGKNSTWADFPKLIMEEFPGVDIGMYSYVTALRRLRFWRSISIEDEAGTLGDLMRGLDQYRSIVLLGHSLGGILCKGAVAHFLWAPETQELTGKISGIFLMASPQLGSIKVPAFLSWATADSRVLKAHSDYLTRIESAFREYIHSALSYPVDEKRHIPCWALKASDDFWVDRLSAGIGLSADQQLTLDGTHSSIVKPRSKNDEGFRFVSSCITHAILNAAKPKQKHDPGPARLEDLNFIHELAISFFGEPVSDLGLMREWWSVNENVFWVLRRVTTAQAFKNEEIVAYFSVIPVTPQAASLLRDGTITGASIPSSAIVPADQSYDAVYIGAVAGKYTLSKALVILSLTTYLESTARSRSIEVLARPVTADGLRVVEDYGMTPTGASGLGHLYQTTLGERQAVPRKKQAG